LERVRLFLSERGLWSEAWQQAVEDEAANEIDRAVELAERMEPLSASDIFDGMFEDLPPHLRAQQAENLAGWV
jgi:TPP-dependent pyruvate/acetoin dehydrogenase alpha subunit